MLHFYKRNTDGVKLEKASCDMHNYPYNWLSKIGRSSVLSASVIQSSHKWLPKVIHLIETFKPGINLKLVYLL